MATGLTARPSADCWIQSSPVERLSSREHAQGSENQLSFHCDGSPAGIGAERPYTRMWTCQLWSGTVTVRDWTPVFP